MQGRPVIERHACETDEQLEVALEQISHRVQSSLDRLVAHCSEVFDCPISLITFVGKEKQRILAAMGTDMRETPREISFCQYAIASDGPMFVADTHQDERFHDNPMVTGAPGIRTYLGYPIRSPDGQPIGALNVVDTSPHQFEQRHFDKMKYYAGVVEDMLELHFLHLEEADYYEQLQRKNSRLKNWNRVFEQASQVAKVGFWEYEPETEHIVWSDEVYRIHDCPIGEVLSAEQALQFYVEADRERVSQIMREAIDLRKPYDFEATIVTKTGATKIVRARGELRDLGDGSPIRLCGVFQDITNSHQSRLALEHAARHDQVTGLLNRHAFDNTLQSSLAASRTTKQPLTLLLFDLDGFKDVNDTFGHIIGDVVLTEIASRIAKASPPKATVARWGGDEFAIVLPVGTALKKAEDIANIVLNAIRHSREISGYTVDLSATCGIASTREALSAKELIRRADTALYHGKRREPGKVHQYSSDFEAANVTRLNAISALREAMEHQRVFAGYQPIIDIRTGAIQGFEALMRARSDSGRILTAADVLPALLEPVLSRDVSQRMLSFVSRDFQELQQHFPNLQFLSINATEGDLLSTNFAEDFLTLFRARGVDLERVTLEVTETMLLVNDTKTVREVLKKLSKAGVKIALDDFGTGYSSLTHLRDFPIDKVKIDGSFSQSITEKHQSRMIVQALISMAKSMQIDVIAEGIESAAQRDLLLQMGCESGQGFLFSPAKSLDSIRNGELRDVVPNAIKDAAA